MDEHIIEGLGKSRIIIKNGKVVDVSEPEVKYCPLFHHHRNIKTLNKKAIKDNMTFRIEDFGMCTPNRQLRMKDFLQFGISEIMSTLLEEGEIDCSVMVCEGCGSLIVNETELIQGIGGRVSGLVKTTPIPEIIAKLGKDNIVNPKTAKIDQVAGVKLAIEKGYKNIAVTIACAKDCNGINKLKEENPDLNIYVFVVHTTGLTKKDARILFDTCEIATSCASKYMREIGDKESLKTVGQSIPIYAKTEKGKEFLELRLKKIAKKKSKKESYDIPDPLV